MRNGRTKQEEPAWRQLADCLLAHLYAGLLITDDTIFFAESTYGFLPEELPVVFADHESDERLEILGLVIFPPTSLRRRVEPYLAGQCFGSQEEAAVLERLLQNCHEVSLILPDETKIPVPFEQELAALLIKKLYLRRELDAEICQVLAGNLPAEVAVSARVLMRCLDLKLNGEACWTLCKFIESGVRYEADFLQVFEFFLVLLQALPRSKSVGSHLFDEQDAALRTLSAIREFERKREVYGMEYLMMQRYPVPSDSEETVLRRLQLIRLIVQDILKLDTPPAQQIHHCELGSYHTGETEKVFRKFY